MKRAILFVIISITYASIFSQNATLIINKISNPPVIDGSASDAIWTIQPRNKVEKPVGFSPKLYPTIGIIKAFLFFIFLDISS